MLPRLTPLGLGCAPLGNLYHSLTDQQASETVAAAWDAGFRYFDTAPYYGLGRSEQRIGAALQRMAAQDFVISTKVGRILDHDKSGQCASEKHGFIDPLPFVVRFDYSYDGIMGSYEASLKRLGLSQIDILLVHDIGRATHGEANSRHFNDLVRSGYRALDELRSSGQVKAIGLGVNEWEICLDAMRIGRWDCFLLAGRYTLLEQVALHEFFPDCILHGAKIILGGAYNSGILATGTRSGAALRYNYDDAPRPIIDQVSRIEAICDRHGVTLAAAALQFPLAHPAVASVIPGLGDPQMIELTKRLAAERIPSDFWADLTRAGLLDCDAPVPMQKD